jgi:hypothetical protein
MSEEIPALFRAYPKSKFPLRLLAFSPMGDLVIDSGEVEGFTAIPVPGLGPGSVRYHITLFGDGDVDFSDDPTCGGTVSLNNLSNPDVLGRLLHFTEIVQEAGRRTTEGAASVLAELEDTTPLGDLIKHYFEQEVAVGEKMLEAAAITREMLQNAAKESS